MNCTETVAMNTVELSGLSKIYGSQFAVDNISLSVGAGESLAIIGHNGAGKTTLIKLILGLTRTFLLLGTKRIRLCLHRTTQSCTCEVR